MLSLVWPSSRERGKKASKPVWQLSNSSHLLPATEPCAWSCCIWCEYSRLCGTKYDLVYGGRGGGGVGVRGTRREKAQDEAMISQIQMLLDDNHVARIKYKSFFL